MDPKQSRAGHKRRANGLEFERIFYLKCCQQGIQPIQMPLGCERRGKILIQISTPFDWILIHDGIVVFIDCKSLEKGVNFPYSLITPHQLHALEACQMHGCQSGYIVWFREINSIVFFNAALIRKCRPGESLHAKDGTYLGTIEEMTLGNLFV